MRLLFLFIVAGLFQIIPERSRNVVPRQNECLECHSDLMDGEHIHAPMHDACENCHESTGQPHPLENTLGFTLVLAAPELCYGCHEALNANEHVHYPVQEGDCMGCHSIHSGPHPALVKQAPTSNLCFECHDAEIQNHTHLHGPLNQGLCEACHNPHQSEYPTLLKKAKPALCFECHEQTQTEFEHSTRHEPFVEDCATCHAFHGSEIPGLLIEKTPALCTICHGDLQTLIDTARNPHSPLTEGKNCMHCHHPHASGHSSLLHSDMVSLCTECHNEEIHTGKSVVRNIASRLQEGYVQHAALQFEGCITCHQPHASGHTSLLKNRYPPGIYVRGTDDPFALCFDCHDNALLKEEYTRSATNFRNGNQNLHYLHSHGHKGRSCHLCHDNHGSTGVHLINDRIPYGNWTMEMHFIPARNGGSCFPGCHGKFDYDRERQDLARLSGSHSKMVE